MNKVFGIIITYKLNITILEKYINSLADQLNRLVIVNNTLISVNCLKNLKSQKC